MSEGEKGFMTSQFSIKEIRSSYFIIEFKCNQENRVILPGTLQVKLIVNSNSFWPGSISYNLSFIQEFLQYFLPN
jgi:hypothetical protein